MDEYYKRLAAAKQIVKNFELAVQLQAEDENTHLQLPSIKELELLSSMAEDLSQLYINIPEELADIILHYRLNKRQFEAI